ncbi:repressed By RIM101 protein 1-like [Panicum virgatum]|uniref:repressed By RIM101 protein 1-like n=1 Tax=Panicum virgatum TaxID=38727 RepID=UPI0019D541AB|nr:repressed By RIM101 protein 1-like [Panicum virgatum]
MSDAAAPRTGASAIVASDAAAPSTGASAVAASGAAAPRTGASAVAALGKAAPRTGASAAVASAAPVTGAPAATELGAAESGNDAPVSTASGTIGLAEVTIPEDPAPAVAAAIAAEAAVTWAPADEPAMEEELLGRGALATKRRSLQQKQKHLAQGKRAE